VGLGVRLGLPVLTGERLRLGEGLAQPLTLALALPVPSCVTVLLPQALPVPPPPAAPGERVEELDTLPLAVAMPAAREGEGSTEELCSGLGEEAFRGDAEEESVEPPAPSAPAAELPEMDAEAVEEAVALPAPGEAVP
jgi:hypothetical protein